MLYESGIYFRWDGLKSNSINSFQYRSLKQLSDLIYNGNNKSGSVKKVGSINEEPKAFSINILVPICLLVFLAELIMSCYKTLISIKHLYAVFTLA